MAPAIVGHLGNGVRPRRAPAAYKHLRQGALDSLDTLDSVADARIDRIARTARDLLGATGASVTLLELALRIQALLWSGGEPAIRRGG